MLHTKQLLLLLFITLSANSWSLAPSSIHHKTQLDLHIGSQVREGLEASLPAMEIYMGKVDFVHRFLSATSASKITLFLFEQNPQALHNHLQLNGYEVEPQRENHLNIKQGSETRTLIIKGFQKTNPNYKDFLNEAKGTISSICLGLGETLNEAQGIGHFVNLVRNDGYLVLFAEDAAQAFLRTHVLSKSRKYDFPLSSNLAPSVVLLHKKLKDRKQEELVQDLHRAISDEAKDFQLSGNRQKAALNLIKELTLDPRPLLSQFSRPAQVGKNMELKRIINPHNKPLKVFYGASGVDLLNVLLATNGRDIRFLTQTNLSQAILLKNLNNALNNFETLLNQESVKIYAACKHFNGSAESTSDHRIPSEGTMLIAELNALGVSKDSITIQEQGKGAIVITFQWQYLDQVPQEYRLTYYSGDLTKPQTYPQHLKDFLNSGIDIYFQRAAVDLPLKYHQYLDHIKGSVNPGGFLLLSGLTNQVNKDKFKHFQTQNPHLREPGLTQRFKLQHWQDAFQNVDLNPHFPADQYQPQTSQTLEAYNNLLNDAFKPYPQYYEHLAQFKGLNHTQAVAKHFPYWHDQQIYQKHA